MIVETKSGRQALLGSVVIDATGDLDVAARAGAPHVHGSYIVTPVFRLGGVDTDAALRFEAEHPVEFAELDRQARRVLGGSWDLWWLKTPLPGIVWCNCPHLTGYDAVKVEDLTAADLEGRRRIAALVAFARAHLPGFERCYVVDTAPQLGVRQTRLLQGEYVVTKEDVLERRHFPDTVCRGRDYYTPYRALLPARRRAAPGRRPPLLGRSVRPEDLPRDPALHGAGPGRRPRRGARALGRRARPRRRSQGRPASDASPGRRSGRRPVIQRHTLARRT